MTTTKATTAKTQPVLTGYATSNVFFASRYRQGGRTVYSLDLSPQQIMSTVEMPDVNVPSPGNRQIRSAHADSFAKYFREQTEWVSPSLMLRTPKSFSFEVESEIAGIQFGVLDIPRRAMGDIHIVDGQHRILGMFRAEKGINIDIDKARSALALIRHNQEGGAGEKEGRARVNALEAQRARLAEERINVQIFVESDPVKYKQMFFDIADNQLGITASVKSRFDSRKVVHRSLAPVMEHKLLKGNVDPEGDHFARNSPYIMGAKHVAEIIRTLGVGLVGRFSRRVESEMKEQVLIERSNEFFDELIEAFPQMRALSLGQITADDLRQTSLLGSVLFVRALAGAKYDLQQFHAFEPEMVEAFFAKLNPFLSSPVYTASIWIKEAPAGAFSDGARSPNGRRQDMKNLKDWLVGIAIDKPKFLDEEPAPRPEPEEEWVDPEVGIGYTAFGADVPEPAHK